MTEFPKLPYAVGSFDPEQLAPGFELKNRKTVRAPKVALAMDRAAKRYPDLLVIAIGGWKSGSPVLVRGMDDRPDLIAGIYRRAQEVGLQRPQIIPVSDEPSVREALNLDALALRFPEYTHHPMLGFLEDIQERFATHRDECPRDTASWLVSVYPAWLHMSPGLKMQIEQLREDSL